MQFGRIDLSKTNYNITLDYKLLNPIPIEDVHRVYSDYCAYKNFQSVMPMIDGRFSLANTEVFGYYEQHTLIAWSMYRIWDAKNIVIDHHAWDYKNPKLRMGIRSLENECAVYRDRGYKFMFFESIEPYMLKLQGFEILGLL
jgi:hypothetical protein